jgi:DNA-binding NarL/FixJ family response regulator
VSEAQRLNPDIVLLDMKMPEVDGRTAAAEIKQRQPDVRVMMLSGAEIDDDVFDTLDAGVDGYVMKDVGPDELSRAIRMVAAGQSYIHADVTRALLNRMSEPERRRHEIGLTPRETDVLRLLTTSATYQEIGDKLFISEETVRSHVKRILSKLDQPNRTTAVVAALKLGLISLE